MIVHRGPVRQVLNGKRKTEGRGDIVFLKPGDIHSFVGENVHYTNLAFPLRWLRDLEQVWAIPGMYRELTTGPALRMQATEEELTALEGLLDRLMLYRRGPRARRLFCQILHILLADVVGPSEEETTPHPEWLTELLDWMAHNHDMSIRTSDVVKRAFRSREHVCRAFQRFLHVSPSQFLNRRRLKRAAGLLASTNYPISDVAEASGFQNLSYFCRLFRSEYAESPRSYRQRHMIMPELDI